MANKITKSWIIGDYFLAADMENLIKSSINDTIDDVTAVANSATTNASGIGTNASGIGTNASTIATQTGLINNLEVDVQSLSGDVTTNATDISTNATDISTNATDISTNATDIGNNTTAIGLIGNKWTSENLDLILSAKTGYERVDVPKLRITDISIDTAIYGVGLDADGDVVKTALPSTGAASPFITGGTATSIINRENGGGVSSGDNSFVMGELNLANASNTQAFGNSTSATTTNAHAQGTHTLASGSDSHAQNSLTIASNNHTHAGGHYATASGYGAFAHLEGAPGTQADASGSHSGLLGGRRNNVSGDRSLILGGQDLTNSVDDTVMVPKLNIDQVGTATATWNLAVTSTGEVVRGTAAQTGTTTVVWEAGTGADSVQTVGTGCDASGSYSLAAGKNTIADGYASTAFGQNSEALQVSSFAQGTNALADGGNAIAMGNAVSATSNYSVAIGGYQNIASGLRSAVIGGTGLVNTVDDTVMVPYLNIQEADVGTAVKALGLDSTGRVIENTAASTSTKVNVLYGINGFDRESLYKAVNPKQLGVMEYCHLASSGEVHIIGSDENGTYTKETGRTTFADGTALADRTLSIYKDAGESEFSYWNQGNLVEHTIAKKIQLPIGFGGYIYFDETNNLTYDLSKTAGYLIKETVLIAIVHINTSGDLIWLADERHGILQDGESHLQAHNNIGFFLSDRKSLVATGLAEDSATFTSVSEGKTFDEDIAMFISSASTIPKIYKLGVNHEWVITDNDDKFTVFNGAIAQRNNIEGATAVLEDISGNNMAFMTLIATNNKLQPLVTLIGQEEYLNVGQARDRAPSSYSRIEANGLPSHEFCPVYGVIVDKDGEVKLGETGEIGWDFRGSHPVKMFL